MGGFPGGHSGWPVWIACGVLGALLVGAYLILSGQVKP